MGEAIESGQNGVTDPEELLRRVGQCYLDFARSEPGWFDVAFFAVGEPVGVDSTRMPAVLNASPFRLLQIALARLVAVGRLAPDRTEAAALMCWSGVHGFATLSARGPLASLPSQILKARGSRLVDDLVAAVTSG
jgi:hypothetical protein